MNRQGVAVLGDPLGIWTAPGTAWWVISPVASTTQRLSVCIDCQASEGVPPMVPNRFFACSPGKWTANLLPSVVTLPQQQPAEKQPSRPSAWPSDSTGIAMSASRRNSMSFFFAYQ